MTWEQLRTVFLAVANGDHPRAECELANLDRRQLKALATRARTVASLADTVRALPRRRHRVDL